MVKIISTYWTSFMRIWTRNGRICKGRKRSSSKKMQRCTYALSLWRVLMNQATNCSFICQISVFSAQWLWPGFQFWKRLVGQEFGSNDEITTLMNACLENPVNIYILESVRMSTKLWKKCMLLKGHLLRNLKILIEKFLIHSKSPGLIDSHSYFFLIYKSNRERRPKYMRQMIWLLFFRLIFCMKTETE